MEAKHVCRAATMRGSDLAFLDQRIPEYQREIINIIGMGVTENVDDPGLQPKISSPAHGFALVYSRAENGKGAALHAHTTEEVFIPIRGQWEVYWLDGEEERALTLDIGDVVNLPTLIYRGFRRVCDDPDALLLALAGGPDPGNVAWHPGLIERARETGLEVDDDGTLRKILDAAE